MITTLRLTRLNRGLTQTEVAKRVGIHRSAISNVELRRLVVNEKSRQAIAAVVGGKVEDFFDQVNGLAI